MADAPAQTLTTCCNPWAQPRSLSQSGPVMPYVAAVTVCGLVAKVEDDNRDEQGVRQKAAGLSLNLLAGAEARAVGLLHSLDFPVHRIRQTLKTQSYLAELESVRLTGEAYSEIVGFLGTITTTNSNNRAALKAIGYELGFLTHLKDAWDDWEEDRLRNKFNPLRSFVTESERKGYVIPIAQRSFAALKVAFDQLKVFRNRDLLHAVLIDGVASRVDEMAFTREEYEQRMKDERSRKKKKSDGKDNCCDWCDCGGCDCNCKGCPKCSGKSGGKDCDGPCDCNPCDGDCCGCDCSP